VGLCVLLLALELEKLEQSLTALLMPQQLM
jgi:hypothetical protein